MRAVQSLAEVGFDQVLDALEELRQGPSNPPSSGKSKTAPLVIEPARTLETPDFAPSSKLQTSPRRLDSERLPPASREATSGRPGTSENAGAVKAQHEPVSEKRAAITDENTAVEAVRTPRRLSLNQK